MRIIDIIRSADPPRPWALGDNIPWNDPEFSERMLREHLSPEHDLASRRIELIEKHTRWIHDHVLKSKTARILDLCCGPGLYGVRLAPLEIVKKSLMGRIAYGVFLQRLAYSV